MTNRKIIRNPFVSNLAIDLGTVNTLIYSSGDGIVLNEPSTIARNKYTGETVAIGREAEQMFEQEPYGIDVHHPMKDGSIADFDLAEKMVKGFLPRVSAWRWKYTRVLLAIPVSATDIERDALFGAVRQAGVNTVELVDAGLAAAVGSGALDKPIMRMVVDIGGGTTNYSVIAPYGVLFSWSLKIAGRHMSEAIMEYLYQKHQVLISFRLAEEIKVQLGFATEPSEDRTLEVFGKSTVDGTPQIINITAAQVAEALDKPIQSILHGVHFVFQHVSPEVGRRTHRNGMVLTGGGSLIQNLGKRFAGELRIPVQRAENPLEAVALGAGQLVENPRLFKEYHVMKEKADWHRATELSSPVP